MSFFSSKKKQKEAAATAPASAMVGGGGGSGSLQGSPPMVQHANGPSAGYAPPVQVQAPLGAFSPQSRAGLPPGAGAPIPYPGATPAAPSLVQQQALPPQTLPPQASTSAGPSPPQQQAPGAPPAGISYPWSQRPINLAPPSYAPNSDPSTSALAALVAQNGGISPPPFPRYGHAVNSSVAASTGELYIYGGLVRDQVRNDLYMLQCQPSPSVTGGSLTVALIETRGEVPGPRVGHACVGVGNVLIVWGGDTKTEPDDVQDSGLYLLNLSSREWTRVNVSGAVPEGRYGHTAGMVGSRLFLFGGQRDDGSFLNDLWSFDLQKLKQGVPMWTQIVPPPGAVLPPKRTGHTSITFADNLFIFGGTDGQYHYNDTWQYDTTSKTWSELQCIGYIPVPREGHAATLVDDVMYVLGGRGVDGKDLEDLAAFRISNQRWYMFQNMGPAPTGRSGHAMATWGSRIYVCGGESYTSTRADNPNMVHVLDTAKIKYPQDANRKLEPAGQQKQLDAARARSPPPHAGPSTTNDRAASPVNGRAGPRPVAAVAVPPAVVAPASFGQAMNTSPPTASPPQPPNGIVKAPQRPWREGDDVVQPARAASPTIAVTRSVSPNGAVPAAAPRPRQVQAVANSSPKTSPPSPYNAQFNGQTAPTGRGQYARSPSPHGFQRSVDAELAPVPPPAASTPAAPVVDGKREQWMRTALALASQRGFLLPPADEGESIEGLTADRKLVETLVQLKTELGQARSDLVAQAAEAERRVVQSTSAQQSALQEAAYCRAKLHALESGLPADYAKVDRERSADLERKLAGALSERQAMERRIARLESEHEAERTARAAAEERAHQSTTRVEATETSYSRALTDYAELQRRAHANESTLQQHVERVASLSALAAQHETDHSHARARLETTEATLDQYLRTLESTQLALAAANAQADEFQVLWAQSKAEADAARHELVQLRTAHDQHAHEAETASTRVDELERVLKTTRAEHDAMRALTHGGLAELVAAAKQAKSVDPDDHPHVQQLRVARDETEAVRALHSDSRTRAEAAQAELAESHERTGLLERQLLALRSEVAVLRSQHASALDDASRHRNQVATRELDLRERSRAVEAAEAKAGVLRAILAEHGLTDDGLEDGSPRLGGSEAQLVRRIQELEARLEARDQTHRQLESAHDDARRDLEAAEHQLRESGRHRQTASDQVAVLTDELNRARSPGGGGEASSKAEIELAELTERHRGLEASHAKAVQYGACDGAVGDADVRSPRHREAPAPAQGPTRHVQGARRGARSTRRVSRQRRRPRRPARATGRPADVRRARGGRERVAHHAPHRAPDRARGRPYGQARARRGAQPRRLARARAGDAAGAPQRVAVQGRPALGRPRVGALEQRPRRSLLLGRARSCVRRAGGLR